MNRSILHAIAGILALFTVVTFWLSTVMVEVFFTVSAITAVKVAIAFYGLPLLVLFMAMTGISGTVLARNGGNTLCPRKKARMRIIALNGVLIMVPSALFLAVRAQAGVFDLWFFIVQAIELAVGLIQISLIGLNIRDGRSLSSRHRQLLPCSE